MGGVALWLNGATAGPTPTAAEALPPGALAEPELTTAPASAISEQAAVVRPVLETAVAPGVSAPPESGPAQASLEDMVSRVMPAVVLVETPSGRGSGFYVAPDTLLTNVHVVAGNTGVTLRRFDGTTASARVETINGDVDIAVLKVSNPVPGQPTIRIGSALTARVGQEVIAIGSALGTLQNTVTRGIVSALRQSGAAMLVQTDAAVNPGNSGGPLLDRHGSAIGITTLSYKGQQGLNFAVAIDHAQAMLSGRPAPVPVSTATASPVIQGLSPAQPSERDQTRASGEKALEQALAQLSRRAESLDEYWRRFRQSCYEGRIGGAFDREWFAVFDARALSGAVSPGCGPAFDDIKQQAMGIRDAVLAADESARQADVYPGVRRDARRRHRLDYSAWDR